MNTLTMHPPSAFWRIVRALLLWAVLFPLLLWLGFALLSELEGDVREAQLAPAPHAALATAYA
ncbi:hypothetical protein PFX98_04575 [Paucibacter sediminis]|uniref:Uncharacterized protein n=1 Tax=Paucibacter sediminis TaxID=3019553 RepID=A0AA95NH11_9BURK|nr:hypothetical protein [Paucibacter sp. S2-9]WIT12887.1 hypothetical protein PFX98_04575 [Paucibacter sp. S2-9]